MSVIRDAFNYLAIHHSKDATLKRPVTKNQAFEIYSPCRICPSQYYKYTKALESSQIHQREFVIPLDTMKGQATEAILFSAVPSEGAFKLTYGANTTDDINFDALAADVQSALRLLDGLENVTVSGNFTGGFVVNFIGVNNPSLLSSSNGTTPLDATITIKFSISVVWDPLLNLGDRIIHPQFGTLTIKEIEELYDLGADLLGFRVRVE